MKETQVCVNQIELHIQEYEQDGDPIIFLHFSGANLQMWQRVIPYFQDRYRLILIDLRGHGKSDRPATGYHMDEMAQDVIGIMQHLNLERAHVVGSSLGAEVGLSLAANHPEKVISLICDGALSSEFGPYGTWEGSETAFEEHVAHELEKIRNAPLSIFPTLEALVDNRREIFMRSDWWNEYLEAVVRYDAYPTADGQYGRGMGKQALENYMRHYYHYRFEDYYPKVTCPVLMLAEKDLDDEREKAAIHGLCALTAQGQIAEIDGWAHPYCWLLDPDGACQAILRFLDTAVS
ncbi:MAG: alpha/beta hydrolase [Anaerolineales bacterium]|nr:alpha/beta hydrolase [Anaerolineales bacterium]